MATLKGSAGHLARRPAFFRNITLEACMDLNLAKTFLTVMYGGSFVQAAERLCVSQTTVTARIKNLEEQLGTQLCLRSEGGASLTPAGDRLIPQAQRLVTCWGGAWPSASVGDG